MKDIKKIDLKILQELLKDGRKSLTILAEELHESKDTIWKHYKEMVKAGIIVGATTQFNYTKFGYTGVATILLSVESQHTNNVFERLNRIPDIQCFRYYNSKYNLGAISTLKNLEDLEYVKRVISERSSINEMNIHLWTDVRNIPENILAGTLENKTGKAPEKSLKDTIETSKTPAKIDEIDIQIVEKLTKNGRMPFRKIAQEMGVSTDTVARRYEKLFKNNFVKVSIQFNPRKLGYQGILNIRIAIANQSETVEIAEKLAKIPGVTFVVKMRLGNYDLHVASLVKDCEDIFAINDAIEKIPNVKRIDAIMTRVPPFWPGPRQYISTF